MYIYILVKRVGAKVDSGHSHVLQGRIKTQVPPDWKHFMRGKDLLVRGWGSFDIAKACVACRALHRDNVPSAATLRAFGYHLASSDIASSDIASCWGF